MNNSNDDVSKLQENCSDRSLPSEVLESPDSSNDGFKAWSKSLIEFVMMLKPSKDIHLF